MANCNVIIAMFLHSQVVIRWANFPKFKGIQSILALSLVLHQLIDESDINYLIII